MTIFGWDMSHYDSPNIGNANDQGIVFITHKAGGDANDGEIGTWWQYAKPHRADILLGAYWVLRPDTSGSMSSKADAFLARLDATCAGWRDGPFILQVDCEKWNGSADTVPSVAEINTFCDRLVAKCPKLVPIVYAPDWVYGSLAALKYPLWSSKYVTGSGGFKALYPGDSSSKWAAYGGKTPSVLQYTSSATIGGQATCDANAFRGTIEELTKLVSPGFVEDVDNVAFTDDDKTWLSQQFAALNAQTNFATGGGQHSKTGDGVMNTSFPSTVGGQRDRYVWQAMQLITTALPAILAAVQANPGADTQAIISGVLAGLPASEIAAAIPQDMAQEVIDGIKELHFGVTS